jgi:hypothetical protein
MSRALAGHRGLAAACVFGVEVGSQSVGEHFPAGIGERHRRAGRRHDQRHRSGRADADGKLACFRPPPFVAEPQLGMEHVALAVALEHDGGLPRAVRRRPHPGWAGAIGHEHLRMAVAAVTG